jgi:hypothetical protein
MTCYELSDPIARRAGKVDEGNIHNGTDVLGYRISARSLQPSAAAQAALLAKLDNVVKQAKAAMNNAAAGKFSSQSYLYHQAMVMMSKITWGWSQSFKYANARHVLESLDSQIDVRIAELQRAARHCTNDAPPTTRRRVTGIHLLQDTYAFPLPAITGNCFAHEPSVALALAG